MEHVGMVVDDLASGGIIVEPAEQIGSRLGPGSSYGK
jgi:hypothetical protein